MDVYQNTGINLSNQIQFAACKHAKAEDPFNYFSNRGFQVSTGSSYKIHVTPFSVYCEQNNSSLGNGNMGYAWQLCADPMTSGQQAFCVFAGGHRHYNGGATLVSTNIGQGGQVYNGTSGGVGAGEFMSTISATPGMTQFKGGRIFMWEDWIQNGTTNDPIQGRLYGVLIAGGLGVLGFEIPSGTGTITYTRIDAINISNGWSTYLRTT